jgi:cyclopropane-fatty-acyl-phospholipid synthase
MMGIELAEAGLVPDFLTRAAIRRLLRDRLREITSGDAERELCDAELLRRDLSAGPIAVCTRAANEQHYEVPAAYFERVLGARLKYSSGFWEGDSDLDQAEEQMLALTCQRAGLEDGMHVLDLGCGWGSLSLWIAEHYPNCRVVGVSNSKSQRESILGRCHVRGFENVEVQTCDINYFDPGRRFDRIVSVEMFEHVRNHARLLARIASWLSPEGRLFVHHFSHREHAYAFEDLGADDWMARYFFSGGLMPSDDHLLHFQRDLVVQARWRVSGTHYQKTADAWLERQDAARDEVMETMVLAYGADAARRWYHRWRLFHMACSELFGFRNGNEWWVSHVLMGHRAALV